MENVTENGTPSLQIQNTNTNPQPHNTTRDVSSSGGNTSTPDFRCTHWCMTINNYDQSVIDTLKTFPKYIFQEETGKNGTKHLQCLVSKRMRFSTLKRMFPRAHIEKCKNVRASIKYCSKTETRTGQLYSKVYLPYTGIRDLWLNETPKEWQLIILGRIKEEPCLRKIYWYYDLEGGKGKTLFCKHLCLKYNAIVVGGKLADAQYGIAKRVDENKSVDIVVFDIPRCQGNKVSYSAIESIKNGLFFSSKYESKMCLFDCPHVIVFANEEPDMFKLSLDRWVVIEITE